MPRLRDVTDAAQQAHRDLLAGFHRDVARRCFVPEELEPIEEWLMMLAGEDEAQPAFQAKILVDGDGDGGGEAPPTVVGGVTYERYPCGVSLLTYLAVHPDHQRRGYGKLLCNACCSDWSAAGTTGAAAPTPAPAAGDVLPPPYLFLEAHRSTTADEHMDPTARLRMYSALGFRALRAFEYIAPPVEPGSGIVEGLVLLVKVPRGSTATHVPADVLAAFIPQYWAACEGATDTTALDGMLAWLGAHPLVPLVAPELC